MVEMLGVDVRHDGDIGGQLEERAVRLVRLHHHPVAGAKSRIRAERIDDTAVDHGRIEMAGVSPAQRSQSRCARRAQRAPLERAQIHAGRSGRTLCFGLVLRLHLTARGAPTPGRVFLPGTAARRSDSPAGSAESGRGQSPQARPRHAPQGCRSWPRLGAWGPSGLGDAIVHLCRGAVCPLADTR